MFAHIKPNYITINRRRHYSYEGQIYPSISTILAATKPEQERQALQRWRNRVGAQQAQKISTAACRRGTSVHKAIQYFLTQQPLPDDVNFNNYWHSIKPVLEGVATVYLVESTVYNQKHGYAGQFDCLGEWQGELCLFDWKTASKPKKLEWITDYCLQVTAYTAAINHLYNVKIEQGIIAIALEDRLAQIFHLNTAELQDYWEQFLIRLQLWKSLNRY